MTQGADIQSAMLANADQLESIFMPEAAKRRADFREKKGRFVHYTSAEAAHSIISKQSLWMRNATCMNDFSEIRHGFELLQGCLLQPGVGSAFDAALDACFPNTAVTVSSFFLNWSNDMKVGTYIACLSEHIETEDQFGRLSMWRAYGSKSSASVALVLRVPLETGRAMPLGVVFTPVAYFDQPRVIAQIRRVTENIMNSTDYLRGLGPNFVVAWAVQTLRMAAVSLKHPGFDEEREWRVVLWPNMPRPEPDLIAEELQTVGGVPQKVYLLPLRDRANGGVDGLEIPSLIDRVIIGPTQYPIPMFSAFSDALRKAGVTDPEQRVWASNVPLRT